MPLEIKHHTVPHLKGLRAVGTGGAQGHVPPQYLEQPVVVPLQYFQQILGLTKWVPPQYLAPSHGPVSKRKPYN